MRLFNFEYVDEQGNVSHRRVLGSDHLPGSGVRVAGNGVNLLSGFDVDRCNWRSFNTARISGFEACHIDLERGVKQTVYSSKKDVSS